jgi:hypothetical protein
MSQIFIGLHVKYPLFLLDFNQTWIFSTDFWKILRCQISRKFYPWEPTCSMRSYPKVHLNRNYLKMFSICVAVCKWLNVFRQALLVFFMVTLDAASFNNELCVFHNVYLCIRMVFTRNSYFFPVQNQPIDLSTGSVMFSLWGTNRNFIYRCRLMYSAVLFLKGLKGHTVSSHSLTVRTLSV